MNTTHGCFASLEAFRVRVVEVGEELRGRKEGGGGVGRGGSGGDGEGGESTGGGESVDGGGDVDEMRVVVTSDEEDEAWWDEVRKMGWVRVDHERLGTERVYGKWYVDLLFLFLVFFGGVWRGFGGFWFLFVHLSSSNSFLPPSTFHFLHSRHAKGPEVTSCVPRQIHLHFQLFN